MNYSYPILLYEQAIACGTDIKLSGTDEQKAAAAQEIIQHIFHNMLGWTDEEAIAHISPELAEKLRLDDLKKALAPIIPADCPKDDWPGIVTIGLGQQINPTKQIQRYYKLIRQGKLSKFPKQLFTGQEGRKKASLLLHTFIAEKIALNITDETKTGKLYVLYETFAETATMNNKLTKAGLYYVYSGLYSNPLEFLHESLSADDRDEFLYTVFSFRNVYNNTVHKPGQNDTNT